MIIIGSDHAGFKQKEKFIQFFKKENIEFEDVGCFDEKSCNYPEIAKKLCDKINTSNKGILICGSGIGMSMSANKFEHIRAALCVNKRQAELSRRHNNANVLVLQGRNKCFFSNKRIFHIFDETKFEGGRHKIRIDMFSKDKEEL